MEGFKITPAPVPGRGRRGGTSVYEGVIEDFLKQDIPSALIESEGRKSATVYIQLRNAAKNSEGKVSVVQRGGQVFLVRE